MAPVYIHIVAWLLIVTYGNHAQRINTCFGLRMRDIRNIVGKAIADARTALDRQKELNNFLSSIGFDEPLDTNISSPKTYNQHYAAFILNMQEEAALIGDSGFIIQFATKAIVDAIGVKIDHLFKCNGLVKFWREQISSSCTKFTARCNPRAKYRSVDGSCNNINNPLWGRSNRPYQRYLPSSYRDDLGLPRMESVSGGDLPSPRAVSNMVHRQDPCCPLLERSLSQFVQQWGQLIDHDFIDTAIAKGSNDTTIKCCGIQRDLLKRRSECLPIKVPPDDGRFNTSCMNFVRAVAGHKDNCDMGRREQLNMATSFVDASFIYGHTETEAAKLRLYRYGRLRMTRRGLFPPRADDNRNCMIESQKDYCMLTGDSRLHVFPGLTAALVMFLREHNRIAGILRSLNPHWVDEELFQETRKIVIAEVQHITYSDWLPLIIGDRLNREMGLSPKAAGHYSVYNSDVDPTVSNIFGVAPFRFGHSMLNDTLHLSDGERFKNEEVFNRPTLIFKRFGTTLVGHGLALQESGKADGIAVESIRDNLFLDEDGKSFDLFSLNIQRGRDHGVPGYNSWRVFCGLPFAIHFGTGFGGLVDHTIENARKFQSVYRHPEDIDVFSGGISEIPVNGGVVGPLFACIIGRQFQDLKYGDRFFYEYQNGNKGFTHRQINSVKKMTLAKLMCLTLRVSRVQRNPFLLPSRTNREVDCNTIPDIDFSLWRV